MRLVIFFLFYLTIFSHYTILLKRCHIQKLKVAIDFISLPTKRSNKMAIVIARDVSPCAIFNYSNFYLFFSSTRMISEKNEAKKEDTDASVSNESCSQNKV